jgi:hypothetical protein
MTAGPDVSQTSTFNDDENVICPCLFDSGDSYENRYLRLDNEEL